MRGLIERGGILESSRVKGRNGRRCSLVGLGPLDVLSKEVREVNRDLEDALAGVGGSVILLLLSRVPVQALSQRKEFHVVAQVVRGLDEDRQEADPCCGVLEKRGGEAVEDAHKIGWGRPAAAVEKFVELDVVRLMPGVGAATLLASHAVDIPHLELPVANGERPVKRGGGIASLDSGVIFKLLKKSRKVEVGQVGDVSTSLVVVITCGEGVCWPQGGEREWSNSSTDLLLLYALRKGVCSAISSCAEGGRGAHIAWP